LEIRTASGDNSIGGRRCDPFVDVRALCRAAAAAYLGAMPRRFSGDTLVIASHNKGKIGEIADLLGGHASRFPAAAEFGIDDPEETGDSFAANAELKARHVAERARLPALADDSGLVVPALGGAP